MINFWLQMAAAEKLKCFPQANNLWGQIKENPIIKIIITLFMLMTILTLALLSVVSIYALFLSQLLLDVKV